MRVSLPPVPHASITGALLDLLDESAAAESGVATFVGRQREPGAADAVPLRDLVRAGLCAGAGLRAAGIGAGDVVLVALPTSPDFVIAMVGAILIGALPCPVPEGMPGGLGEHPFPAQVRAAAARFNPRALVATGDVCAAMAACDPGMVGLAVTVDSLRQAGAGGTVPHRAQPGDLVHIQLTSGSTGTPKAVALSHRAVVANITLSMDRSEHALETHRGVCWLPLFHDMGLITLYAALYYKRDLVLLKPDDFIINPMGWLATTSRFGCTTTAVPNFALAYCVRRYRADLLAGVDLSCLHTVVVGAEKIHLSTLRHFTDTFAPFGFNPDAFYPCFGTAELTLAVTAPQSGPSRGLGRHTRWHARAGEAPLVGLGPALHGTTIEVRAPDGAVLPEGEPGEVFVRSPCMMDGYYMDPDATAKVLRDGFYATGDQGYLHDGELYLIGRIKELIILRGRNYPPHEFEECAAATGLVDIGRIAAFGAEDEQGGSERLVLAVEPETYEGLAGLRLALQQALRARFEFGASEICFVRKGGIPRTTSRKIRRGDCARLYASKQLPLCADAGTTTSTPTH